MIIKTAETQHYTATAHRPRTTGTDLGRAPRSSERRNGSRHHTRTIQPAQPKDKHRQISGLVHTTPLSRPRQRRTATLRPTPHLAQTESRPRALARQHAVRGAARAAATSSRGTGTCARASRHTHRHSKARTNGEHATRGAQYRGSHRAAVSSTCGLHPRLSRVARARGAW